MNELEKAKKLMKIRSQYNISKELGIAQSSLSHYRSGRLELSHASWETIHQMAEYYDEIIQNEIPKTESK